MKQYGVEASAHATKRAWKYKFSGELYIFNLFFEHPVLEKSYVIYTVWSAKRRTEEKEMPTRCSSFLGLLFHTIISAIVFSSCVPQRRNTIRTTLGKRDQFRMTAVTSGREISERKVVGTECAGSNVFTTNGHEVRTKLVSGLVAKRTASSTAVAKDNQKIRLWRSSLVHVIVVEEDHSLHVF
ncbi:hypothetical protein PILCRDRAFT_240661 [Piloderma croceum F 1598]|uniref:Uncharacterized protein n=1 Tax=Piloderma croceum (strain F 1598) TaxID=765440 RepID=A0A0C3FX61_PILCF|nr:hypothetical protein PILCRDRAFT_240661 [Piloderma croceum F 1598]